jgi:hypothetical protein
LRLQVEFGWGYLVPSSPSTRKEVYIQGLIVYVVGRNEKGPNHYRELSDELKGGKPCNVPYPLTQREDLCHRKSAVYFRHIILGIITKGHN